MKILRKDDNFKKLPERDLKDQVAIQNLIDQGWNYCAKQIYKDFFKGNENDKPELKLDNQKKKDKSLRLENKPEKRKIEKKTKAQKKDKKR